MRWSNIGIVCLMNAGWAGARADAQVCPSRFVAEVESPVSFAQVGDDLFWTVNPVGPATRDTVVRRVSKGGGDLELMLHTVFRPPVGTGWVYRGYVYQLVEAGNVGDKTLWQVPLDGGVARSRHISRDRRVFTNQNRLYIVKKSGVDPSPDELVWVPLSDLSAEEQPFYAANTSIADVDFGVQYVYIAESGSGFAGSRVQKVAKDLSRQATLTSTPSNGIADLLVFGSDLYFQVDRTELRAIPLVGGAVRQVATVPAGAQGQTIYNGVKHVWWETSVEATRSWYAVTSAGPVRIWQIGSSEPFTTDGQEIFFYEGTGAFAAQYACAVP